MFLEGVEKNPEARSQNPVKSTEGRSQNSERGASGCGGLVCGEVVGWEGPLATGRGSVVTCGGREWELCCTGRLVRGEAKEPVESAEGSA